MLLLPLFGKGEKEVDEEEEEEWEDEGGDESVENYLERELLGVPSLLKSFFVSSLVFIL